jgi:hypothetical protein
MFLDETAEDEAEEEIVYTVPDKIVFKVALPSAPLLLLEEEEEEEDKYPPSVAPLALYAPALRVFFVLCVRASVRGSARLAVRMRVCAQNYSSLETGYPNTRKLLLRMAEGVRPAKRYMRVARAHACQCDAQTPAIVARACMWRTGEMRTRVPASFCASSAEVEHQASCARERSVRAHAFVRPRGNGVYACVCGCVCVCVFVRVCGCAVAVLSRQNKKQKKQKDPDCDAVWRAFYYQGQG